MLLVYYYLIPNLVSLYSVPLFSALPLSIINCITTWAFCQEVFPKSLWKTLKVFPTTTHLSGRASHLLTPLLYHNLGNLSRGKLCCLTLSQRTCRALLLKYLLSLQTNKLLGTLSPMRRIGYHQLSPLDNNSITQTSPEVNG